MPTLSQLITTPGLASELQHVAGPDGEISSVVLLESLDQLAAAPAGSVAVLTVGASADAGGYQLDMALRMAGTRRVGAIVLTDGRSEIPATASTIAERAEVAVTLAAPGLALASLLFALQRVLTGGPDAALGRLAAVLDALSAASGSDDPQGLVASVAAALGRPLARREPADDELSAPVVVDGGARGSVCASAEGGHADTVVRAAVELTAAAVTRAEAELARAEEVPVRSRGELLTEFLLAGPDQGDRMVERLRAAGLAVDAWHAVVRFEVESLESLTGGDETASFHLRQQLGTTALAAARSVGGTWHRGQVGSGLLLVRMQRRPPGSRVGPELTRVVTEILRTIRARLPHVPLVCGVGSVHQGATGLRASAAEAHSAVAAARAARRLNVATSFDGVGLQRTLVEWYASDTAREMVESLLEPLDRLGRQKADVAIRTLQAYLDHGGSLSRTAEALHLHRNAVSYRVDRIFGALDVDRDDPETRLMLQLACRARLLR